ncbi:MAG: hypothetical protein Q4Q07_10240 [Tissierellia bacterium]|nr:hypothetical protein [Tissierellia bacterium]
MNKRLVRKYNERKKLEEQREKLDAKLKKVAEEIEELEKTEIYKNFISMDISLEEYKKIMEQKITRYQGIEELKEEKNE